MALSSKAYGGRRRLTDKNRLSKSQNRCLFLKWCRVGPLKTIIGRQSRNRWLFMDFFWERGTRPASASCSGYTTRNATKRTAFPLAECLQATSEVRTASCWLRDGPFLLFYLAIESVVEKAGWLLPHWIKATLTGFLCPAECQNRLLCVL